MADNILYRTAYIEVDNRAVLGGAQIYRPCDWAMVQTTLGMMAEPFQLFARNTPDVDNNYDPSDEMCRIDKIENVSMDTFNKILSHDNESPPIHGGHLIPRIGR